MACRKVDPSVESVMPGDFAGYHDGDAPWNAKVSVVEVLTASDGTEVALTSSATALAVSSYSFWRDVSPVPLSEVVAYMRAGSVTERSAMARRIEGNGVLDTRRSDV